MTSMLHPRRPLGHAAHLAHRFFTSLSARPPAVEDIDWARRWLTEEEWLLWSTSDPRDQRHTVAVARTYVALRPEAKREEIAGALLHDIGKLASGLGTAHRVLARVVGPRTHRLRVYHDHEPIGAQMVRRAGSHPLTVAMVGREETSAAVTEAIAWLWDADNRS